jgi:hypothetical protein
VLTICPLAVPTKNKKVATDIPDNNFRCARLIILNLISECFTDFSRVPVILMLSIFWSSPRTTLNKFNVSFITAFSLYNKTDKNDIHAFLSVLLNFSQQKPHQRLN